MASVRISFDPAVRISEKFGDERQALLEEIGEQWQDYSESRCPVLTGFLRSTLGWFADKQRLVMGATAEYAEYVEDRLHFMEASFVDAVNDVLRR